MGGYISTSTSVNWGTPHWILERYKGYFDPCPFPMPFWDGLEMEWASKNFVNPPFSKLKEWSEKCAGEYMKGKEVVLLMPARVDTRYFHSYVLPYAKIEFIKGRIKYLDLDDSSKEVFNAPFPTIIAHYRHHAMPIH